MLTLSYHHERTNESICQSKLANKQVQNENPTIYSIYQAGDPFFPSHKNIDWCKLTTADCKLPTTIHTTPLSTRLFNLEAKASSNNFPPFAKLKRQEWQKLARG